MCFLLDLVRKKKKKKNIINIQFNKIGYFFKKKNGQNSPQNIKKGIFVTKITNAFDFSSQKSKKKSVMFFSDFSHGITLLHSPVHSSTCSTLPVGPSSQPATARPPLLYSSVSEQKGFVILNHNCLPNNQNSHNVWIPNPKYPIFFMEGPIKKQA